MSYGFPLWLVLTHFLNILFLTLLARSGLGILSAFPKLYLSDHCPPGREFIRFSKRTFSADAAKPWSSLDEEESWSPGLALPGRKNLGLARHWHFMTIQFWILTGIAYVVLLSLRRFSRWSSGSRRSNSSGTTPKSAKGRAAGARTNSSTPMRQESEQGEDA